MRKIGNVLSQRQAENAFDKTLSHNRLAPWKKRTWTIYNAVGEPVGIQMLDRSASATGNAEIGIMLLPRANGKRIAVQALSGLVAYGICQLRLQCIEATFDHGHLATRKLITRIGFHIDETRLELAGRVCCRGAITASKFIEDRFAQTGPKSRFSKQEIVNKCSQA